VDGELRIVRGAWGSVGAAITLGFVGTIAFLMLLQSLWEVWGSGRLNKLETRFGAVWQLFLATLVLLGGWSIAGAHRTLSAPAVRKVIGPRRERMLLLSWAGIPLVPAIAVLWWVCGAILVKLVR
jgi:TM2 domain-containing membrane protein YozV